MTRIVHRLVGYDPETESVAVEVDIPDKHLSFVKRIAKVSWFDPDAAGSYPLTADQTRYISGVINEDVAADRYDFFLEPFADPDRRRA